MKKVGILLSEDKSSVQQLKLIASRAFDAIRGGLLGNRGYLHVTVLFFLKFVSDLTLDRANGAVDDWRPAWRTLIIPSECSWESLRESVGRPGLYLALDHALEVLERSNPGALHGISIEVRFEAFAEQYYELSKVLDIISQADLRPSRFIDPNQLGDFFEWLIGRLAEAEGRSGMDFHVPGSLAEIFARVLAPQPGHLILDPFCGSGTLLSRLALQAGVGQVRCAGQHPSPRSLSLCKMNLIFHGIEATQIQVGNSLRDPLRDSSGDLLKADVVLCNPPFGWRNWGGEDLLRSRPELFGGGLNPRGGSEYAFLEHMLSVARKGVGRIGIIVSPGALFRQEERESRRRLVEENLLAAVVGLPPNLFHGTGIPAAILLVDKAKATDSVLFVDASRSFEPEGRLNRLSGAAVQRIVGALRDHVEVSGFSRSVRREEIRALDFHLGVASYVENEGGGESLRNARGLSYEIREIEGELAEVRSEIDSFLGSHDFALD